jgi:hypothetical protein
MTALLGHATLSANLDWHLNVDGVLKVWAPIALADGVCLE